MHSNCYCLAIRMHCIIKHQRDPSINYNYLSMTKFDTLCACIELMKSCFFLDHRYFEFMKCASFRDDVFMVGWLFQIFNSSKGD